MENEVIAKEYIDKNYIYRDEIKQIIEELRYYANNPKEAKHYVAWYLRKIDTLEELLAGKLLEEE